MFGSSSSREKPLGFRFSWSHPPHLDSSSKTSRPTRFGGVFLNDFLRLQDHRSISIAIAMLIIRIPILHIFDKPLVKWKINMFSRKYIWRLCPFSSYVSWSRSLVHMIWCFFWLCRFIRKKNEKTFQAFCWYVLCFSSMFSLMVRAPLSLSRLEKNLSSWECIPATGWYGMVLKNGNKPSTTYINYKQTERVETILLYYKQLYIYCILLYCYKTSTMLDTINYKRVVYCYYIPNQSIS